MPHKLYKDREEFEQVLSGAAKQSHIKLAAPMKKAILSALSERDETASICRDIHGNPEPDPELRDTESIQLPDKDDPEDEAGIPESVRAFFEKEVLPHVPDAWIDTNRRDHKDAKVGIIGYEINFNRYFYTYKQPRCLDKIEGDIRALEKDIVRMLSEITGSSLVEELK